jgi:hypothetical protein
MWIVISMTDTSISSNIPTLRHNHHVPGTRRLQFFHRTMTLRAILEAPERAKSVSRCPLYSLARALTEPD